VLAIAPLQVLRGPYRNEIIIGNRPNILWAESHKGLGAARRGDELDPNRFGSVQLDDGAQIAAS
jgi:hypothetical protein